ncbi:MULTISPECIES: PrsW family glutamic-type intramembrane protease [Streptomyces]|uniref:PrsW family glutamic-type intramembrane protease n=1 Tax=Streptomyces eurythermus TaxID=42237 RepID=A0ABW6Z7N4_9ACTN|nr:MULTISPECIES: PrsW family glutamic-type intramembrane protease [Streptomyces]QIS68784.1 PrsW family intramembrane metalloprotease [Streptomyces sp. DSM 40868]
MTERPTIGTPTPPSDPASPSTPAPTSTPAFTVAAGGRLLRHDEVTRGRALLVARLVIGVYLLELLLNMTRPHVLPDEPSLTIFWRFPGMPEEGVLDSFGSLFAIPRTAFWGVLAGIVVGIALQAVIVRMPSKDRRATVLTWAALAALLGSFALFSLFILAKSPLLVLACVPTSAFALWLIHRAQRFGWLPLPMLLTAFGWGALIQWGVGRAFTNLAYGTINGYMYEGTDLTGSTTDGSGNQVDFTFTFDLGYRTIDVTLLHLSTVNQLAAAVGVVLLILMFRHRVTDVVTGLVLGAAAGLGYNFTESVIAIELWSILSSLNGATGGFEYWIRQSASLFGSQVVFGALVGAGIGLAAQTRRRAQRVGLVTAGLVAAIGGAVANEVLSAWLSGLVRDHVGIGGTLDTLVISPAIWLAPQVPFLTVCLLLLRSGIRARVAAARTAVTAEAAEAAEAGVGGAITEREVPFLMDPALRFWALVSTWRRHGPAAARALRRFQRAQLEVAGWRWQQERAAAEAKALGAREQPQAQEEREIQDAQETQETQEVQQAQEAREEGEALRARAMRLRTDVGRLVGS